MSRDRNIENTYSITQKPHKKASIDGW
jgi:hypothetical protein